MTEAEIKKLEKQACYQRTKPYYQAYYIAHRKEMINRSKELYRKIKERNEAER